MTFEIIEKPIDVTELIQTLRDDSAGACASFEGWVRNTNEGQDVTSLEYEAHGPLAVSEGEAILAEALERFELLAAMSCHRVGHLEIGDCAVWVGVSAPHRGAAFEGCRYIIDQLKQRLPIWKKEYYRDGHSDWINCVTGKTLDDA
jgi:molybdopterin synthase catalytic subunit